MKKTYSFSLILLLLIVSCKKPKDFYAEVGKGTYLTLLKQGNALLNAVDPASTVSQDVNSNGSEVASVNLYISATATTDKTKWKLIKNIPFTSPTTTLSATNTQIATALGLTPGAIPPGNIYHLYNEVVLKDGTKFSSVNTSAPDLENQNAFNVAFHWTATVVCPFTPATVAGTYKVLQDDWDGLAVGSPVQVTTGTAANTIDLSQVWPDPTQGIIVSPLIINVDPISGIVTVPIGLTFGNYGSNTAVTGTGNSGFVFSCTGIISIRVHIIAPPFGDQGFFQLILKKQ